MAGAEVGLGLRVSSGTKRSAVWLPPDKVAAYRRGSCPYCEEWSAQDALDAHILSAHQMSAVPESAMRTCPDCHAWMVSRNLRRHQREQVCRGLTRASIVCPGCQRAFGAMRYLRAHLARAATCAVAGAAASPEQPLAAAHPAPRTGPGSQSPPAPEEPADEMADAILLSVHQRRLSTLTATAFRLPQLADVDKPGARQPLTDADTALLERVLSGALVPEDCHHVLQHKSMLGLRDATGAVQWEPMPGTLPAGYTLNTAELTQKETSALIQQAASELQLDPSTIVVIDDVARVLVDPTQVPLRGNPVRVSLKADPGSFLESRTLLVLPRRDATYSRGSGCSAERSLTPDLQGSQFSSFKYPVTSCGPTIIHPPGDEEKEVVQRIAAAQPADSSRAEGTSNNFVRTCITLATSGATLAEGKSPLKHDSAFASLGCSKGEGVIVIPIAKALIKMHNGSTGGTREPGDDDYSMVGCAIAERKWHFNFFSFVAAALQLHESSKATLPSASPFGNKMLGMVFTAVRDAQGTLTGMPVDLTMAMQTTGVISEVAFLQKPSTYPAKKTVRIDPGHRPVLVRLGMYSKVPAPLPPPRVNFFQSRDPVPEPSDAPAECGDEPPAKRVCGSPGDGEYAAESPDMFMH